MEYLLIFMAVPIIGGLAAKYWLHKTYSWKEFAISIGITLAAVAVVFFVGSYAGLQDVEIWNGKIVSKHRDHGHYLRSYSCNCTQVCSGSGETLSCTEVCQTCYEDRYTVSWYAKSTIGNIGFKSLDRSSRSVYSEPDPAAYKKCLEGEPASLEKSFTNYVKATPDSLFNTETANLSYADKIPSYPRVYSFYKIKRVVSVGAKIKTDQLEAILDDALIDLGRKKQVNIIVILTEIDDPYFKNEVENAWLGGKKNDVVVFIGLDESKITWADVMTWALSSGNELFQATLKQELLNLNQFDSNEIAGSITKNITNLYDRPSMKEYEYLKDDIQPSMLILSICFLISIILTVLTTIIFHKKEI